MSNGAGGALFWRWLAVLGLVWGGCFPPALPREVDAEDPAEVDEVAEVAEVEDTEVDVTPVLGVPAEVVASTERAGDVEVTWQPVPGATGYRVLRCAEPCDAPTEMLVEVSGTRHVDTTVAAPGLPVAPTLTASVALFDRVQLSWDEVVAPAALRYRYRVVALGADEESAPSEVAVGHRAERPVIGYEVELDGWKAVPGLVTSWDDVEAPAATLEAEEVVASRGTYAGFVRVAVTASSEPGAARAYRVRAMTDFGPGAASEVASGHRVAGPLAYQWERSAAASDDDYVALQGATSVSYDDTSAPADGGTRHYRAVVSAEGAVSVTSDGVPGSRQGPPGVVSGLAATSNLAGFVRLTWQAAEGAHGYHVYRDGAKLTSGGGITATSFDDALAGGVNAWTAPSGLTASQDQSEHVALTWVASERPLGTLHSYHVTAVNDAAESVPSASASGRRAGPALVGFEVGATIGGVTTWRDVGLVTSYLDTAAPRAPITGGTVTASQGDFRAHVVLTSSGGAVGTAAAVTYAVRGILSDETRTPMSGSQVGRRAVGALSRVWQRSAGSIQGDWSDFEPTCTEAGCGDSAASELGDTRWYRVDLRAAGAEAGVLGPVEGWRLAFVSVSGSCAVSTDGRAWCWGAEIDPVTPEFRIPVRPRPMATLSGIVEVAGDIAHGCARTATGALYCWGAIANLGVGVVPSEDPGVDPPYTQTPVHVASLSEVTSIGGTGCASLSNGEARCWGMGFEGQLGNNDPTGGHQAFPVHVRTSDNEVLTWVSSVSGGWDVTHRCARMLDGTAHCWGDNRYGQLGQPSSSDPRAFGAVPVAGLSQVVQLAVGGDITSTGHTCALVNGGTVRCWGYGGYGQLGQGELWGEGHSSLPLTVLNLTDAVEVSASQASTCARRATGAVVCWGSAMYDQIGLGGEPVSVARPVQLSVLTSATALGSHGQGYCAIQNGHVYCWGANWNGQIGDGTTLQRSVPTPIVLP